MFTGTTRFLERRGQSCSLQPRAYAPEVCHGKIVATLPTTPLITALWVKSDEVACARGLRTPNWTITIAGTTCACSPLTLGTPAIQTVQWRRPDPEASVRSQSPLGSRCSVQPLLVRPGPTGALGPRVPIALGGHLHFLKAMTKARQVRCTCRRACVWAVRSAASLHFLSRSPNRLPWFGPSLLLLERVRVSPG